MIKKLILALVILPAVTVCAQEKPDGLLGTDFVMASGSYSNVDMGYYSNGADLDYAGMGLRLNKHIADSSNFGVEASLIYSYTTNQNNKNLYSIDSNDYKLLVTLYRISDSVFTPYFSAIAGFEQSEFDAKVGHYNSDFDTTYFGAEAGVEVHLLEGLSFTPYFDYEVPTSDEVDSQTTFGASLNYWLTKRVGVNLDANYSSNDHVDTLNMSAGLAIHF